MSNWICDVIVEENHEHIEILSEPYSYKLKVRKFRDTQKWTIEL
jgi:hypothetical protein